MHPAFDPIGELDAALRAAAGRAGLGGGSFDPGVRTSDPRHGDFQANGVLAAAKSAGRPPRPAAEAVVGELPEALRAAYLVSVAGPGFINFRAAPATLLSWLSAFSTRQAMQEGASAAHKGQTWVVDYSSPNAAKQMHVGHLRSAVIGEAICRILAFAGARVVRDNHLGDWGTQYGKLIWACKRHLDEAALARDAIGEFERLYKLGNAAAEADPAVMDEARAELVRLQAGDPENTALWRRINAASLAAFQRIYDRLGIRFDHTLGESFYNDKVERVYAELAADRISETSEGAQVVFHPEHPRFKAQPLIVRKSDGAANYASTDLATILYRVEHLGADCILYVVDKRQGDHFEQLFLTAGKWFAARGRRLPRLEHVDFGTVLGEGGRPLKTREGDNIRLRELLDEASERAFALVTSKSPEFPEEERRRIADVVGVGSVQYADLSQNRASDYVFSWDKMISLEGNTAAYLLYAVARIRSIFRKQGLAGPDPALERGAGPPETPAETALARRLLRFADALRLAGETLSPHFLCLYLYELAGEFSTFYNADKVIVDDPAVKARRLMLCSRTLLVLETGLGLLGLRVLERM
ncbi:MAG TPA: arginine--tRNA ligase [Opitutaceae bacterium]|jgi:arginyl-tRNA synthetase